MNREQALALIEAFNIGRTDLAFVLPPKEEDAVVRVTMSGRFTQHELEYIAGLMGHLK